MFLICSGYAGRLPCPAKVLLVATHVDKSNIVANSKEEYESSEVRVLLETTQQKFEAELNIYPKIFIVDSHLAMSQGMKALRNVLSDIKNSICQVQILYYGISLLKYRYFKIKLTYCSYNRCFLLLFNNYINNERGSIE